LSLNFLLKANGQTFHIFKYIILTSISLSIIALVSNNQSLWITSPRDHFYFELFGTIFAGILAFYYVSRALMLNDKFSLFIGIGFLVNALIDLLHVYESHIIRDYKNNLEKKFNDKMKLKKLKLTRLLLSR
jgi:hypothetical protein